MLHFKVFTSAEHGDNMAELEESVNTWLGETRPLVHTMSQSPAGSGVVISFLYEEDEDATARVSVATAEAPVEVGARRIDLSTSEAVMITLLPQAELPY
ncbi:MAG TPA: hypothetical protein VF808_09460 [Ktedonobacterales bacterium]